METNALQEVNDAEPIPGLPDHLELSEGEAVERWQRIPKKAAQLLSLVKMGFTPADIQKAFGIDPSLVKDYRLRYDPQGDLILPKSVGKHITAHTWERTALRALAHIDVEKLDSASAASLATVAGIATDKALRLRESIDADKLQADVSHLTSALRQYVQAPQSPKDLEA